MIRITKALNTVYATDKGKEMLDAIVASDRAFNIVVNTHWVDGSRYSEQEDNTLYFEFKDPSNNSDEFVGDKNDEITMIHEITHVYNDVLQDDPDFPIISDRTNEIDGMSNGNYMRSKS